MPTPRFRLTVVCASLAILTGVSGCGGNDDSFQKGFEAGRNAGAPATNAAPAQTPAPAAKPVSTVVLPTVVGKNGAIARDELVTLGFTKVEFAADAKSGRQMVLNPANWTVTKVEPAAGSQVRTDQTVVLTMTK